ncbi:nucleoside triphosphate pyrophosphohydrolase [Pleionea sediminis]|uniref:nucleoside triphosphate pyrophosphohydrolase n=1 Tax=Pleionea sediminis TaxID=2569479 RepID=UPI001FE5DAB4|nr:nucleoside triphosphate pyrophosphohydrolase [Pleionea sediminis]
MDQSTQSSVDKLLAIMKKLRDPEFGCPWDVKQSYESILPYTIEETYEVVDAIERKDYDDLKGELGDLLFQVVFYCQIASEENRFEFSEVVDAISHKLVTRHPHVFSDKVYQSDEELHLAWEKQKAKERKVKKGTTSLLDDIPISLPALKRAQKVQKRAAKHGFDWPSIDGVWQKLEEEILELKDEVEKSDNQERIEDELGDVLFSVVNLTRHLKSDSETALRRATNKFEKRFRILEKLVNEDKQEIDKLSIDSLEYYWQKAKTQC